jgi:FkbM family methyltransferase
MSVRRLISALPPDFVLTVVDVGSAGGLHQRWRGLQPVLSAILFEPREGGAATGELGRGQSRTYPVALSDRPGEAPLYITALPNMSSILEPDAAQFGRYRKKGEDARVVRTETVPVERLDTLAQADGFAPDVLKVDTQGSELLVLKGAEQSLCSVMVAEIEVSFFRRYVGQPLFGEIEAWTNERGFELIELHRLKRYRTANSLGIRQTLLGGSQRSGRVAYGDAIFMRTPQSILAAARGDGGASLLKAIVALLAYGKADHAAALLDAGAELLPGGCAEAVRSALARLNRRRILPPLAALLPRS